MAILEKENEAQALRQNFRHINRLMVLMWRLGLGRFINIWPDVVGRIMVIVHTGRKTGKTRYTPLNYAIVDGELYCTAGFGVEAHWYKNIKANPQIEVWLPDGRWEGVVEEITDSKLRLPMLREVLIASGMASELFAGIDPLTLPDEQLETITATYRLLHIRRNGPLTGPGGPGEWAWVWPLLGSGLAIWFLRRWLPRRTQPELPAEE